MNARLENKPAREDVFGAFVREDDWFGNSIQLLRLCFQGHAFHITFAPSRCRCNIFGLGNIIHK